MIVLILVAVLWIAVLVPLMVAKLRERRSALAIGEFHHRLDLLERTGPKLVEPAYRLAGSDGGRATDPIVVAAPPPARRPNLRLVSPPGVRPAPEPGAMGGQLAAEQLSDEVWTDIEVERELASVERSVRRGLARRRRRDVFAGLCGFGALSGLVGMAPPLRGAWYALAVDLCALVGFLGLAAYGQRLEDEREHLESLVSRVKTEERSSLAMRILEDVEPRPQAEAG